MNVESEIRWLNDALPRVMPAGWRELERRADGFKAHHSIKSLVIIISAEAYDGKRWLHLSCSHRQRLPKWSELVEAKELFLGVERYAYQVVPPRSRYVNIHRNVLHLFTCLDGEPPLPDFTSGTGSL